MKTSAFLLSLFLAATSHASEVPEGIEPSEGPPDGCERTVNGNFTIGSAVLDPTSKLRRETAVEASDGSFSCTLQDGILHDNANRTGAIVSNHQFQFDGPPQAGSIYTGGWSVCKNGSLALGSSTRFWRCTSGGFQNLYDENVADQCQEAVIIASMVDQPTSSSSSSTARSTPVSSLATSFSSTVSASITNSSNGTISTATPSASSASASSGASSSLTDSPSGTGAGASSTPSETSAGSTGGAVPTRVPKRETFGAVIGILGAALIL
ncbi:hypothetical protein EJ04DRAFT_16595 [Polyplosphaeria fusca]|uniref:Cell wall mannoprotein PIR1-like C-terminal domain-containing protein n=1 Tax=Polyplosphaeria fusca TaxID=682080 RepID=A0A9P4V0E0_9PLEO|nr:hypothetical protein EJ04DRAFT_16595 [Polyplosphaeria fusca]